MAQIYLGPYLIKTGNTGLVQPEIEHAGVSLELSGNDFAATMPVYRRIFSYRPAETQFSDYLIHVQDLRFAVSCKVNLREPPHLGEYVSLDCVLVTLYQEHKPANALFSVLKECREYLPMNSGFEKRCADGAKFVSAEVRALGFEVLNFFAYGRTLSIQMGWVFPQDRHNAEATLSLYAAAIDFKPTPDRTMGKGKWSPPMPGCLWHLLAKVLKTGYRRDPVELLSEEGVSRALASFKWTKVTLSSSKEIRLHRLEFIRQHPEILDKPTEMAKAMLAAGFYTDITQISAIKQQLPKLVAEADAEK